MISPIQTAYLPFSSLCINLTTRSAISASTIAKKTPSLATYKGSKPRISHAAATCLSKGKSFSFIETPFFISVAISVKTLANPPLVASLYRWIPSSNSFIKSKSMGELMEQTLEYLKRNYQNVSLIDLI